ncbi:(2Fe-2S) ferredoxin domain-containing protein [Nocardiopsis quinghaiensis]|uniref:(2Fe-2S) ferredoxin domain-containing protein n=1 Tax=Nocardiopsis quinghaiensis TaxID=464995 RepID=UPI001CC26289|nr:(2Fe-2S) ferredoxin domain-containing protein [Nocardiopsis quinghaiensis]
MDHEAQLARLSAIDDRSGRTVPVRTSKCLDICFQANVVVVQPSQAGRAAGGRPVWLGGITEDELVEAVDDWIFGGGPGLAPLPAALAGHVTSKDAKKPKKRKEPKRSKAAKKEREKAKKAEKRAKAERKAAKESGPDKDRSRPKKSGKDKDGKKNGKKDGDGRKDKKK